MRALVNCWRALVLLLVALLPTNIAGAQTINGVLAVYYGSSKFVNAMTKDELLIIYTGIYGSYPVPLTGTILAGTSFETQVEVRQPGVFKALMEKTCSDPPDADNLCKAYKAFLDKYSNRLAKVLPGLPQDWKPGSDVTQYLGQCWAHPATMSSGASGDLNSELVYEFYARYTYGQGVQVYGVGGAYRVDTGYLSLESASDKYLKFFNSCIDPGGFRGFIAKEFIPSDRVALHVRSVVNMWLNENKDNHTTIISVFYPLKALPDSSAYCSPTICPGYTPPATDPLPGAGGTGGTGGTGGAGGAAACTRSDGTTSGNPYDCAPTNSETRCGIIDIPCNLKKLFIPDKDFISNKLKSGVGLNVKFPVTVAKSWDFNLTLAGKDIKAGVKFDSLNWNESTKDQFRFYAWWATFLGLLAYVGVPFMSNKSHDNQVSHDNYSDTEQDRLDEVNRWFDSEKKKRGM